MLGEINFFTEYKSYRVISLVIDHVLYLFCSPLAYLDPMNCNLTHMFVQLFKDALNEYAYAAEIAGLKWDLTNTKYGLIVSLHN